MARTRPRGSTSRASGCKTPLQGLIRVRPYMGRQAWLQCVAAVAAILCLPCPSRYTVAKTCPARRSGITPSMAWNPLHLITSDQRSGDPLGTPRRRPQLPPRPLPRPPRRQRQQRRRVPQWRHLQYNQNHPCPRHLRHPQWRHLRRRRSQTRPPRHRQQSQCHQRQGPTGQRLRNNQRRRTTRRRRRVKTTKRRRRATRPRTPRLRRHARRPLQQQGLQWFSSGTWRLLRARCPDRQRSLLCDIGTWPLPCPSKPRVS